jgi:hypothetical protein
MHAIAFTSLRVVAASREKSICFLRDQPAYFRQAKAAPSEDLPIHSLLGIEEGGRADWKQNALHET